MTVRPKRQTFFGQKAFWLTILLLVTALLLPGHSSGAQVEAWYQDVWCRGMAGQVEVRMNDGRRIDCLTDSHAIEFEFARKWPEAIGQSLEYSMLTGKSAGIVLVLRRSEDEAYWQRLNTVIRHYRLPIRLWKMGP